MVYKFITILFIITYGVSFGQKNYKLTDSTLLDKQLIKPLIIKFNKEGSSFIQFRMINQDLVQYITQSNPGTTNSNSQPQSSSFDIALRRLRIVASSDIKQKFYFFLQVGVNSQGYRSGGVLTNSNYGGPNLVSNIAKRPPVYIHDAIGEFALWKNKIIIGAGLHQWNGVSRLAHQGVSGILAADFPNFFFPNFEATDQNGRQLGIYLRGQVGKVFYNFFLNKPFVSGILKDSVNSPNAVNIINDNVATGAYVAYNFMETETFYGGSMPATYLGAKRVLNVGIGYYNQAGATASKASVNTPIQTYTENCLGLDLFWDSPFYWGKKVMALSLYSAYLNYYFGKNYLRNIATLDPFPNVQSFAQNNQTSWSGGGNLQPTIGTGSIWYTQFGLLLPKFRNGMAVMPFAAYTLKQFELIGTASSQIDVGMSYFIYGQSARITVQYSNWPAYKSNTNNIPVRNGIGQEILLQTQIAL